MRSPDSMTRFTVNVMSGNADRACSPHCCSEPRMSVPTRLGADPSGHVALEVLRPERVDRLGVTCLHGGAVLSEGSQVVRHASPFLVAPNRACVARRRARRAW